MLGPLEVAQGDGLLSLGGAKQRMLLGYLVVHANRTVSVDTLTQALWGDDPPPAGRNALQSYVSRLRSVLGRERIASDPTGYVLRADTEEVDVLRFEQLVREACGPRRNDAAAAVELLDTALGLWRGPVLADLDDPPWLPGEETRLGELRMVAIEQRAEAQLATDEPEQVVAELAPLAPQHPLRERLWGLLMLALYRAGRPAEALQIYGRLRDALAGELGADPGPGLQQLHRGILTHDPTLIPAARHNLPEPISSFVGRGRERRRVAEFLADSRLTTLVGAGGVGKTRLAIEVAREVSTRFPDGVWLADLAPLRDPASVLPAVGAALGVEEPSTGSLREAVFDHVRSRRLLVLLDNCEHLVNECARVARLMLEAGAGVRVLATSRVPLEIPGETVWRVPSLALPGQAPSGRIEPAVTDAVELFVERARAAQPELPVDSDTLAVAGTICRWLDGIALAIELAAARATTMPPAEIAHALTDRFDFLTRGARAALPRHRTLRAMVDWGYDLLADADQGLFDQLSVFAGSFDVEAAGAVTGQPGTAEELRDQLDRLVAASMVQPVDVDGHRRYRLLETLRQYGWERLTEQGIAPAARSRHAAVFTARARDLAASVRTSGVDDWLARVGEDLDNLRAALGWTLERQRPDDALAFVPALAEFAVRRGRMTEFRAPLEEALDVGRQGSPAIRARALAAAGHLAYQLGDYARAARLDDEAVELARTLDDPRDLVEALNRRGHLAIFADSDHDTAAACFRESLALCDRHGYDQGRAWPLAFTAQVELFTNTWDQGTRTRFEEARRLFGEQQDRRGVAHVCTFLTVIALFEQDLAQAQAYATEAVTTCQEARDPGYLSYSLFVLGLVARFRGDLDDAEQLARESLRLALELDERLHVGLALELLAGLAGDRQAWKRAARLWGTADALRDDLGWPYPPFERALMIDRDREQVVTAIGQDRFDALVTEGRAVRPEDV